MVTGGGYDCDTNHIILQIWIACFLKWVQVKSILISPSPKKDMWSWRSQLWYDLTYFCMWWRIRPSVWRQWPEQDLQYCSGPKSVEHHNQYYDDHHHDSYDDIPKNMIIIVNVIVTIFQKVTLASARYSSLLIWGLFKCISSFLSCSHWKWKLSLGLKVTKKSREHKLSLKVNVIKDFFKCISSFLSENWSYHEKWKLISKAHPLLQATYAGVQTTVLGNIFLDAIASPSSYPCQSVSQWVSHW